ncbi:MAG: DUF3450 domain-containing protein [Gammaproteobacteria bacterium]
MRSSLRSRWAAVFAAAAIVATAGVAHAQEGTLRQALSVSTGGAKDGAKVQAQIDNMADETTELLAEFRLKAQELDRLESYNRHLQNLVNDQNQKLAAMDGELEGALIVQQEIIPLMNSMIDNLDAFVKADMPIRIEDRKATVTKLRNIMPNSDVTTAEKYRQIMEAYKTEMDIGRKIESYSGEVTIDGQPQAVNFLAVGRIVFAYQSEDRTVTAYWNKSASPAGWEALPTEYRGAIDSAMRIANKQSAPNLMMLPVAAPENAQ